MTTRRSNRLAAKGRSITEGETAHDEGDDRVLGRRASVGDALGLTPTRPTGRNLVMAKAAGAAKAAADRLDELNAGDKREASERKKRKSSKARKAERKKQTTADRGDVETEAYQAKSRESMALLKHTEQLFDVDEEEESKRNRQDLQDMPALEGDDMSDGSMFGDHDETKKRAEDDNSVIATPGPPPEPTASDEEFIAPEGTPADDPEYEMTDDTDGTDGDDEDELEGGPNAETWRGALREAARKEAAFQAAAASLRREAEAKAKAEAEAKQRAEAAKRAMEAEIRAKAQEEAEAKEVEAAKVKSMEEAIARAVEEQVRKRLDADTESAKQRSREEVATGSGKKPKRKKNKKMRKKEKREESKRKKEMRKKRKNKKRQRKEEKKRKKKARQKERRRKKRKKRDKKRKQKRKARKGRPDDDDSSSDPSDSSSSNDSESSSESSSNSSSDSSSSDSSSSSGGETSDSEGEEEQRRGGGVQVPRAPTAAACTATMVYSADSLEKIKSPWLKYGDEKAKRVFEEAYLKYCAKHDRVMRNRPPAHRILPKAVVECMDPDLVEYVCRRALPKAYRSNDPATVSAKVIHDWVMTRGKNRLGAEDGMGLKKLKAIRIDLGGENGTRSVQMAFIEIRKIRKEYNLQIKEEEIIKNQMYELKPISTRNVIKGILNQGNKRAKRARSKLNKFHDLLMEFFKTFEEARAFGMVAEPKAPRDPKNPKNPKTPKPTGDPKNPKDPKKGKGGNGDKDNPQKGPKGKGRCVYCGGKHFVKDCPTLPKERKNWTWDQHLEAKRKKEEAAKKATGTNPDATKHPGGGRKIF